MKLHHFLLTLTTSLSAFIHAHDIPTMTITLYDLPNCKSPTTTTHSELVRINNKINAIIIGEPTTIPYRTCVDFPTAKSYTLDQIGRNKYSPFCQLGVYQGPGCKNGFTPNTSLNNINRQEIEKKKVRGYYVEAACLILCFRMMVVWRMMAARKGLVGVPIMLVMFEWGGHSKKKEGVTLVGRIFCKWIDFFWGWSGLGGIGMKRLEGDKKRGLFQGWRRKGCCLVWLVKWEMGSLYYTVQYITRYTLAGLFDIDLSPRLFCIPIFQFMIHSSYRLWKFLFIFFFLF